MNRLETRLKEIIRQEGPISIARYMDLCLTDPDEGYYTTKTAIGRGGDFITAPEISQIFGELIGLFFADFWLRSGQPNSVNLVELGPGKGTLMADLLRATGSVPGFSEALAIHLVEVSPNLRSLQAKALANSGLTPSWHASVEDLPADRPTYFIANEFLDALPIHQWEVNGDQRRECVVGLSDTGKLTRQISSSPASPNEDAIVEKCPDAITVVSGLSERLSQTGGVALIIDYGYVGPAKGGTLQAVRNHAFADPFEYPGAADLTAHVDFGPLIEQARQSGACPWGPVDQGVLLHRLGLQERLSTLSKAANPKMAEDLTQAAQRLTAPDQMGSLFKALAITPANGPAPAGFA